MAMYFAFCKGFIDFIVGLFRQKEKVYWLFALTRIQN